MPLVAALLLLTACPSSEADDTGGGDDSATPTGDDSGTTPSTVSVTYSVWTAEAGCWQRETSDLDSAYWWPYGEGAGVACDDVEWYLADGDRCLLFSYQCPQADASADPSFTATPEQEAACEDARAQAGAIPACE